MAWLNSPSAEVTMGASALTSRAWLAIRTVQDWRTNTLSQVATARASARV
jgi:hypothetical protein